MGASSLFNCDSSAPDDFIGLSLEEIVFLPAGPLVECVNITINSDIRVEEDETFSFAISPTQNDPGVQLGSPSTAEVTIVDQEDGKRVSRKPNMV